MSFIMRNRSGVIEGSLAKKRKLPEGSNAILLKAKPMNAANYVSPVTPKQLQLLQPHSFIRRWATLAEYPAAERLRPNLYMRSAA